MDQSRHDATRCLGNLVKREEREENRVQEEQWGTERHDDLLG